MEDYEPKIPPHEAIILLGYVFLLDFVGLILLVLNFFGIPADDFGILDLLCFPVTQVYFRMREVSRLGWDITTGLLELIPFVGNLPLRTIGVAMVIWIDRHPKGMVAKATESKIMTAATKIARPGSGSK